MEQEQIDMLDWMQQEEGVKAPDFLAEDKWFEADISKNILDVTQDYRPPQYSLRINDIPCAPLGGLHGLTGQAGNGKTMTLTMIAAAYLGDTSHGMELALEGNHDKVSVLWIDTEMEPENTMLVNLRICAMLNWDFKTPHKELTILCLRDELTAADRWRKILKAIYTYKPTAVIVDGLIDIVADFNDNKQCQEIIFRSMAVATHYNVSLWMVLHQNPGSQKMVGHAGSFLERKATDVFETKKTKSADGVIFTVSQTKARGKDVPDVSFMVSDNKFRFGLPIVIGEEEKSSFDEKEFEEIKAMMLRNVPSPGSITTTDLRENIKKTEKIGTTKARYIIDKAAELGIIEKSINGKWVLIHDAKLNKTASIPFDTNSQNDPAPF